MPNKKIIKLVLLAFIVVSLDQITKYQVLSFFINNQMRVQEVSLFFNITLVWNHGISFGLFNEASQNQIILITISTFIIIGLIILFIKSKDPKVALPIGLIIGGAIGNIIDRFMYGAVVDFLDFYFKQYHYPAFNIADSCIVIGALLLMLQTAQEKDQKSE